MTPMSVPLLEMRNISKSFDGVPALADVSLTLFAGEVLAVVGENGAGKSTLMRILSGSCSAGKYEGELLLHGEVKRFASPRHAEAAGITMIYQELSLHLDLSVAENIFLGNLPSRRGIVDWDAVFERAKSVMERVGLRRSPREIVRNLSPSLQQLAAIAKALSRDARIIVLDEPTSALTEQEAGRLLELLRSLKLAGISCLYISHKLREVLEIADRTTVLRDGRVVSTYLRETADAEKIIEDMIGRKVESMYPKKPGLPRDEALRVEDFTVPHPYTYNKNIVEKVCFAVRKGEILGIAGLLGAGRSELVGSIFGASPSEAGGRVFVEGKRVNIRHPSDAIRAGIGLLTEDRRKSGYVPTMDVARNITLASLGKISRSGMIDFRKEEYYASKYIEALRVKTRSFKESILALSGGNQQKVVLSKWLMAELKVLILDEPTRGIDVGAKADIYRLMNDLAQQGLGIVMISSELHELLAMCDRLIVLAGGKVADAFSRADASEARIMRAATGA